MVVYFIYLRYAGNLVVDDADALSIILGRANNYLNHRYVLGFRILSPNTSKKCEYMVKKRYYYRYTIKGKEFKHNFKQFLYNAVKHVEGMVATIYSNMMKIIEENNQLYDIDFTGIEHILAGGRLEHS